MTRINMSMTRITGITIAATLGLGAVVPTIMLGETEGSASVLIIIVGAILDGEGE